MKRILRIPKKLIALISLMMVLILLLSSCAAVGISKRVYERPEDYFMNRGYDKILTFPAETGVFVCCAKADPDLECVFMVQDEDGWYPMSIRDGWYYTNELQPRLLPYKSGDPYVTMVTYYPVQDEPKVLIHISWGALYADYIGMPHPQDNYGTDYQLFLSDVLWPGPHYDFFGITEIQNLENWTITSWNETKSE